MSTSRSTRNLMGDLWSTGNWWARRLLIGVVLWHLLTLLVGLIGVPMVTILFMVTVGSALTITAIWYSQPLIPVLAAFTSAGRTTINWVAVVIGLELALGMYLATVPVGINWTTRGLALLALGAALTAIVLKISNTGWKLPITLLWLKFVVLTLIIYAHGLMPDMLSALHDGWMRDQARAAEKIRRGESIWATPAQQQSAQAQAIQSVTRTIRGKIPPNNELSREVEIPTGVDFDWTAPGDVTFVCTNGKKIFVPNGQTNAKLGRLPTQRFRLYGDQGEVIFIPK